jgi:hypothetical protein
MKIKIFANYGLSCSINALEEQINLWLDQHPEFEIIKMVQSESTDLDGMASITITFLYRQIEYF